MFMYGIPRSDQALTAVYLHAASFKFMRLINNAKTNFKQLISIYEV